MGDRIIQNILNTVEANSSHIVQGATAVTSGGIVTNMVIFTDHAYMYLAIVGAVVSMFGVLHELYGNNKKQDNTMYILTELLRGLALGLLAIPFWYLCITEGVFENISGLHIGNVSGSLALIVSFALSWYTIPIFDWITKKVRKESENV